MKRYVEERKKLYKTMSLDEKIALINVWKRITLTEKSLHCIDEQERRGISDEAIERAWKVNEFVEFKIKNGNKRLVVRGLESVWCKRDYCTKHGEKFGFSYTKEECNVCLVVDIETGAIVTCYSCATSRRMRYKHIASVDPRYDHTMNVTDFL